MRAVGRTLFLLSVFTATSCYREPSGPSQSSSSTPTPSFGFSSYTLSGTPFGVVVSTGGTAWIGQVNGQTIKKMNVSNGTFTGTVTLPAGTLPSQLSRNADGSLIYVATFSGRLLSINTSTSAIVNTMTLPGDLTTVIATKTANVLIVGRTDGQLYKVNIVTGQTLATGGFQSALTYHFLWNQDSTRLYVANRGSGWDGAVYQIDPNSPTLATTKTFNTGNRPQALAFSSDWSKLYIATEFQTSIMVWDTVGANPIQLTPITTGCHGYGLLRLPDNSRLYVSCALDGQVVAVNPSNSQIIEKIQVGGRPREIAFDASLGKVIVPNEYGWVDILDGLPPVGKFAAPGCSTPVGAGTYASPWDLQKALSLGSVAAGDTLWLMGGTYKCSFTWKSRLVGTSGAPIAVRPYPGQRVTIDGALNTSHTFEALGAYTYFWDLEFTNSSIASRFGANPFRGQLIWSQGLHNKFLNLIMHDGGMGILTEPPAEDVEIAGNIIYNNGFETTGDDGEGHGLYLINTNNSSFSVLAHDNVLFTQFGNGVQVSADFYANRMLSKIHLTGNIVFNNGTLAGGQQGGPSFQHNIITGSTTDPSLPMTDLVIDSNMTYFSPDSALFAGGTNVSMGTSNHRLENDATLRDNYIVGGGSSSGHKRAALFVDRYTTLSITGNTIIQCQPQAGIYCPTGSGLKLVELDWPQVDGQTWSTNTHYRDPTYASWDYDGSVTGFTSWKTHLIHSSDPTPTAGVPSATKVFVRPVRYANNTKSAGRVIVAVYNWGDVTSVSVSLAGIVPLNRAYELRNVQAPFGQAVTGVYTGSPISIQLDPVDPPAPFGSAPNAAPKLGRRFNAYFISWRP